METIAAYAAIVHGLRYGKALHNLAVPLVKCRVETRDLQHLRQLREALTSLREITDPWV